MTVRGNHYIGYPQVFNLVIYFRGSMNHTVVAVFGFTKPSLKYSPALCRRASTAVLTVQKEKHLLDTITKGDCVGCCYKNAIRCYSLRSNSYTKQHQSKRHALMPLRTLTSAAPSDALGVKTVKEEGEVSVKVVEDALPAKFEEGDWTDEMQWVKSQESKSVLLPPKDVSDIDILAPELRPTFNLAAYVNK